MPPQATADRCELACSWCVCWLLPSPSGFGQPRTATAKTSPTPTSPDTFLPHAFCTHCEQQGHYERSKNGRAYCPALKAKETGAQDAAYKPPGPKWRGGAGDSKGAGTAGGAAKGAGAGAKTVAALTTHPSMPNPSDSADLLAMRRWESSSPAAAAAINYYASSRLDKATHARQPARPRWPDATRCPRWCPFVLLVRRLDKATFGLGVGLGSGRGKGVGFHFNSQREGYCGAEVHPRRPEQSFGGDACGPFRGY